MIYSSDGIDALVKSNFVTNNTFVNVYHQRNELGGIERPDRYRVIQGASPPR